MKEKNSKVYNVIKNRIMIFKLVTNIIILLAFALSPISEKIDDRLSYYFFNEYIRFIFFIMIFGAAFAIIGLIIDYYSNFVIEHDFGLSNQTIENWEKDNLKSIIVKTIIILPIALLFFFIMKKYGTYWWILFGFSFLLIPRSK